MTRLAKLQLIGPLAFLVAVMGAEGAAWALAQSPSSEVLWFINLRLFGLFQACYYLLSSQVSVPYFQFFFALSLFVAASLGLAFKSRLLLAASSNLSFLCVCFMAYACYLVSSPPQAATLAQQSYHPATMMMPSGPDLCMLLILLGATLPSLAASHILYFRSIRAGRGLRELLCSPAGAAPSQPSLHSRVPRPLLSLMPPRDFGRGNRALPELLQILKDAGWRCSVPPSAGEVVTN
jgi:hypothetical protein